MEKRYSPSKLNNFDSCKLKFKYTYIDRIKADLVTIEGFMGSMVHETLEKFYLLVKNGRIESLEWLLNKYNDLWEKNFTEDIKVIKKDLTPEDYFEKGKQGLIDYYNSYKPFNENKIVEVEYYASFKINEYFFRGYIDRLDWNDKDEYFEIHDYKTSNTLMTQEQADNDWQLGIYQMALKDKWPDIEKVKLVWHAMPFNKEIVSFRDENQIKDLENKVIDKVKEIESCKDFPPYKSPLCNWCGFQDICPLWKHSKEMEKVSPNKYKNDSGVKLVSSYKNLEEEKERFKEEIKIIEEEQKKIEEAMISFAKEKEILVIDGPETIVKIDIKKEIRPPTKAEDEEKWKKLRDLLIESGKFQEVATVNANMINYKMQNWPESFQKEISTLFVEKNTERVKMLKKHC